MGSAENNPELCFNIWWFILEGTDWVDQWAVRAYFLSGTDEEKFAVLRKLAPTDFINVDWQPIPPNFVLVSPDGREAPGAATLGLIRFDAGFFKTYVLAHLQGEFPRANRITTDLSKKPMWAEIVLNPLQCDSVVVQTRDGHVECIVAREA